MTTTVLASRTLGSGREQATHSLVWDDEGVQYGERQCFDDTCLCVTHDAWRWRDVTAEEAEEIAAVFEQITLGVRP